MVFKAMRASFCVLINRIPHYEYVGNGASNKPKTPYFSKFSMNTYKIRQY